MKNAPYLALVFAALLTSACTQTTPSMMNNARVEVSRETVMEQIPLEHVNKATINDLAQAYHKSGNGVMDLTMTFDPKSKKFTAMNAVHLIKEVQRDLKTAGVSNVTAQTLPVPEGMPSLMVSFDSFNARAPSDCTQMPGLHDNQTGRFIGDYKFGCGVETALSRQIARPADLYGNADMGTADARRGANVVEGYASGEPREPIEGIERGDIGQ